jgi:hypothetical protein
MEMGTECMNRPRTQHDIAIAIIRRCGHATVCDLGIVRPPKGGFEADL